MNFHSELCREAFVGMIVFKSRIEGLIGFIHENKVGYVNQAKAMAMRKAHGWKILKQPHVVQSGYAKGHVFKKGLLGETSTDKIC